MRHGGFHFVWCVDGWYCCYLLENLLTLDSRGAEVSGNDKCGTGCIYVLMSMIGLPWAYTCGHRRQLREKYNLKVSLMGSFTK